MSRQSGKKKSRDDDDEHDDDDDEEEEGGEDDDRIPEGHYEVEEILDCRVTVCCFALLVATYLDECSPPPVATRYSTESSGSATPSIRQRGKMSPASEHQRSSRHSRKSIQIERKPLNWPR